MSFFVYAAVTDAFVFVSDNQIRVFLLYLFMAELLKPRLHFSTELHFDSVIAVALLWLPHNQHYISEEHKGSGCMN